MEKNDKGIKFSNIVAFKESLDTILVGLVNTNDVRLSNARPASDVSSWAKANNKPSYTASEVGAVDLNSVGIANGVASLGADGKVPTNLLPSYVDDVIEGYMHPDNGKFYNESNYTTEVTGEYGKIYVDKFTNKTYRWSGSLYTVIKGDLVIGDTTGTAYDGKKGKDLETKLTNIPSDFEWATDQEVRALFSVE